MSDDAGVPRPRCRLCRGVIGVYEPLIVRVAGAGLRVTSLAAEPELDETEQECYHEACAAGRD